MATNLEIAFPSGSEGAYHASRSHDEFLDWIFEKIKLVEVVGILRAAVDVLSRSTRATRYLAGPLDSIRVLPARPIIHDLFLLADKLVCQKHVEVNPIASRFFTLKLHPLFATTSSCPPRLLRLVGPPHGPPLIDFVLHELCEIMKLRQLEVRLSLMHVVDSLAAGGLLRHEWIGEALLAEHGLSARGILECQQLAGVLRVLRQLFQVWLVLLVGLLASEVGQVLIDLDALVLLLRHVLFDLRFLEVKVIFFILNGLILLQGS